MAFISSSLGLTVGPFLAGMMRFPEAVVIGRDESGVGFDGKWVSLKRRQLKGAGSTLYNSIFYVRYLGAGGIAFPLGIGGGGGMEGGDGVSSLLPWS